MIFDTGSANFWVNSKLCKDPSCVQHPAYDHKKSKDYQSVGQHVEVTFGTGCIEGLINKDTVHFGGLVLHKTTFGEITDEEGDVFNDGKFSGLLGLSFPSLAASGTVPVFDNIIQNNLLDSNIFSFYYSLNPSETSQLTIGYIDESKYTGQIEWIPIIKNLEFYWLIEIDDIRLGDKSLGYCDDEPCKAAVDTGTSLLSAPFENLADLYMNLDADCTQWMDYPDLIFVIKGKEYTLRPEDYVITINGEGEEDDPGVHSDDFIECTLAMMGLDVPPPNGPL